MATNKIQIDEGSTTNLATNSITEDAVTKHIARSVLNTSAGAEISPATSGKQDTGNTSLGTIDTSTAAASTTLGATSDAAVTAGATGSISAKLRSISRDLLTNIVLAAGTNVIGGVTIADGSSATLGAKADAKSTATDTTAITIMSVLKQISSSVQAAASSLAGTLTVASHAVTNAGTFQVQSTLDAETTKVIGTVRVASGGIASGAIASGAVASGAVASGAFASGSISDGADVTIGAKADAKSTATDTTAITIMSVLKQVSASVQAIATSVAGTLTVASHAVTNAGTFAVQNNSHGKTLVSTGGSASSSGNNTLVAAGTNKLKVSKFSLSTTSTTAMTCIFQSGASGTEIWRVILQAQTGGSTGANLSVAAPDWIFATASATLLNLNLSSANAVHWSVTYVDEA